MSNGRLVAVAAAWALAACGGGGGTDMGAADLGAADLGDALDAGADAGPPVDAGPRCMPGPDLGAAPGYDGGTPTRLPEATVAPMRDACAFGRGSFAEQSVGSEQPLRDAIPIEHFVIFMQENRSFDSYFGTMPGVNGLPPGASNPDASGAAVAAYHETQYCVEDLGHGWNASHREWNGGAMDGFVTTNDSTTASGARAMGYFDGTDLPYYWDLFSRFASSDAHFCGLLGPTWPNREYALSASSRGRIDNTMPDWPTDGSEYVIHQELDHAGVPWRVYYEAVPYAYAFYASYATARGANMHRLSQLSADLACGDLPPVVWIDPGAGAGSPMGDDEHPPEDPQYGQRMVHDTIAMLMASRFWPTMAIVLTYDEGGGYYDHVPPPPACPPGDAPPDLTASSEPGDFDRMGVRVPFVIVSPFSKAHYVSHVPTEHSAILRLLEAKFGLPALTARDANAWPLLDMFDFAHPPFATPPADLADATIDAAHAAACGIVTP